jgi:diadenylate cyclase
VAPDSWFLNSRFLRLLIQMFRLLPWQSVVDFVVLAAALYAVLRWASQARAIRVVLGIVALLSGSLIARAHHLFITSWVLEGAGLLVVAALLIVFQAEVRRAFTRLDSALLLTPRLTRALDWEAAAVAEAAFSLAPRRTGALIVLVRADPVTELIQNGVSLRADLSAALLVSIFQKDSPLHDGAALIEEGSVTRACALLPLTNRDDVPQPFGTRHRAALGLAERCDALVVTVSEERGEVTLMEGRQVRHVETAAGLAELLKTARTRRHAGIARTLWRVIAGNWRTALAAVGLAALVWLLAISTANTVLRTVTVPVVLEVPAGMDVTELSATSLAVQLRGPLWILDTGAANGIVAHLTLNQATDGWMSVRVRGGDLSLPPGVEMERATPATISIRVVRHGSQ